MFAMRSSQTSCRLPVAMLLQLVVCLLVQQPISGENQKSDVKSVADTIVNQTLPNLSTKTDIEKTIQTSSKNLDPGQPSSELQTRPYHIPSYHHDTPDPVVSSSKRSTRGLRVYGPHNDAPIDSDYSFDAASASKRFIRGLQFNDKRFTNRLEDEGLSNDDSELYFEKKFIRGLRSPGSALNANEEKRFMRGLNLARRDDGTLSHVYPPDTDFDDFSDESDNEKILVPRFPESDFTGHGKSYLWAGPAEKKFIRGLNKKYFGDTDGVDTRFKQGFSKRSFVDYDVADAVPDGYFVESKNFNKRFMRGLNLYSKKYVPKGDFKGSEKRFMRGVVKRDVGAEVVGADKRFLRGFLNKNTEEEFRNLLVHPPVTEFKLFSKNASSHVGSLEETNSLHTGDDISIQQETELTDVQGNGENKRFMRGLIKKDDEVDKRLMRGLVKKDVELDKRFMRGLIKKDDEVDKRFMRGLVKKDVELDKRFMRGLIKKDEVDKRFMRGLIKKDEVDKRFMRGLIKKDDEVDKRFMRGLIKKDDALDKRFMRGLIKKDDYEGSDTDKRFMRGLIKKETNSINDDKRFMRGLIKKDELLETLTEDKRFMRGLVKKEDDKRFMKGLVKKDDMGEDAMEEDKRFMRGLVKRGLRRARRSTIMNKAAAEAMDNLEDVDLDDGDRSNTETEAQPSDQGLGSELWLNHPVNADKRFMRGFDAYIRRNWNKDDVEDVEDYGSDVSKRFMRGFQFYDNPNIKRLLLESENPAPFSAKVTKRNQFVSESPKRFMKGLDAYGVPGKRFMRGLEGLGSLNNIVDNKRFVRGLGLYYNQRDGGRMDKRFIRGLDTLKRDWDENEAARVEETVSGESEALPELAFTPYLPAYSSIDSQYSPSQNLALAQHWIPRSQLHGASRFSGLYRGNNILG